MLAKGASIFSLPVFQGPEGFITAKERQSLGDQESQRRWDYFIRTTPADVEAYCADDLRQARRRLSSAEQELREARLPRLLLTGLGLVALIVALGVFFFGSRDRLFSLGAITVSKGQIAGFVIGLLGLAAFVISLMLLCSDKMGRLRREVSSARKRLAEAQQIIKDFVAQIPTDIPSDSEMLAFVEDRLKTLEERARKNLRLDTSEVTVEAEIPPIYEWGGLQDPEKPGYESIARDYPLHHKLVRVSSEGKPVFAVYYVQYLFPTVDYIAVHGEFYDMIMDVTKGRLTDEYYYADVTSVRTEMRERQLFFFDNRHMECTTLRLTVASGDAVSVSMFDEGLQRTLDQYIEDQRKARVENLRELQAKLTDADEEEKQALQAEIEAIREARSRLLKEDRASIANQVVSDVRHQLRARKGSVG